MRNIALFLKYDGSAYHGWQVQKNARSVAQTLEEAAAAIVGHKVHLTGCGRRGSCPCICREFPYGIHDSLRSSSLRAQHPSAG